MKSEIVAEIGLNHNGSVAIAKATAYEAKVCGADTAKFQTYFSNERVAVGHDLFELFEQCILSSDDWFELISYCEEIEINFLTSIFGMTSLNLAIELGLKKIKLPSFLIGNRPLFLSSLDVGMGVYISTGTSTVNELEAVLSSFREYPDGDHAILHCVSSYPTQSKDLNLVNISELGKASGVKVGFSDHSEGAFAAPLAVALGAKVVEKHFTLDRRDHGPDHAMSAESDTFRQMVRAIRETEEALGKVRRGPYDCETAILPFKEYSSSA